MVFGRKNIIRFGFNFFFKKRKTVDINPLLFYPYTILILTSLQDKGVIFVPVTAKIFVDDVFVKHCFLFPVGINVFLKKCISFNFLFYFFKEVFCYRVFFFRNFFGHKFFIEELFFFSKMN